MQDDTGAYGPADDELGDALADPDFAAGEPAAGAARPLTVPRPETGEFRVDAALGLLDELTELPVTDHPAMFEQVHAQLSEVLDELGARMAPRLASPPRRDGS
jgi:hypothetical protein